MKRWFSLSIRIAIGSGLLAVVFFSIDVSSLANNFSSINPFMVLVLCITAVIDRVLMAYKWNLLLNARGIAISIWQAIRLFYVGHLLGTFTPATFGADIYRVTALSRYQKNQVVVSTVLLERLIGLFITVMFALIALPFSLKYLGTASNLVMWSVVLVVMLVITILIVSFCPSFVERIFQRMPYLTSFKITGKLLEFHRTYAEYRFHSYTVFVFTMLSAIEMFTVILINFFAAKVFGINVSFVYFLCVMPLLHIVVRLPISLQGIGVQEGLFAYFLIAAGFTAADGLSISILLRMAEAISVFLPAGIMLWTNPLRLTPSMNLEEK